MLEKTYTIKSGPPIPSADEYEASATNEYQRLLASVTNEKSMQEFLERNPCFVPGALTPGGGSGHFPFLCALVSQPKLTGLRSRQPDFMWIAVHSLTWYPILIEIENPNKRIFKADAIPSHHFTQARNQLAQWRAWFNEPVNVQKFITEYGIPEDYTKYRRMQPHFMLIYGRRDEFANDIELSKQRGVLMTSADEELISFDRLHPNLALRDAITVRAAGYGRYRVTAVMPTIEMGPVLADRLPHLDNLEETIDVDTRIPQARRDFLQERIPYWRSWAKQPEHGIVNTGDRE